MIKGKRLEVVPFVTMPVGWMPCIACSDYRRVPGRMWLGYCHGEDLFITCPVCKGTGEVERFKHIDVRTGKEIDYERPGQTFVQASADALTGRILAPDTSETGIAKELQHVS